jgi:putative DNA primase/helicase
MARKKKDTALGLIPAAVGTTPSRRTVVTDMENARRLVARHGDDIRYVTTQDHWLWWNGLRWEEDAMLLVELLAKSAVRAIAKEADTIEDDDKRKKFLRAALAAEAYPRLRSMISFARSEPGIPVVASQLDTDPWLLNVKNGTLDLRTGNLRPPRRDDLITKLAPVEYHAGAICPVFLEFLDRIMAGDHELIGFLQRMLGYCLTGDTSEQCFFIFYGTGANGKSTLLNAMRAVLGDYARHARTETLLAKRAEGIGNDVARLHGARFVDAVEAEGGRSLAEALVKQLTGGDPVTARFLYQEAFEFKPTFKLCLAVNHKPTIRGTDHAIWRRIRLVPFAVTIPQEERDSRLGHKLLDELPGILAWLVAGCRRWQAEGLGMVRAVREATEAYRGEMDALAQFLAEQSVARVGDAGLRAGKTALYAAYCGWCTQTGQDQLSKADFAKALVERGFTEGRSSQERHWIGIALRADAEQALDDPQGWRRALAQELARDAGCPAAA